jgi:hypothetical protein
MFFSHFLKEKIEVKDNIFGLRQDLNAKMSINFFVIMFEKVKHLNPRRALVMAVEFTAPKQRIKRMIKTNP